MLGVLDLLLFMSPIFVSCLVPAGTDVVLFAQVFRFSYSCLQQALLFTLSPFSNWLMIYGNLFMPAAGSLVMYIRM